VARRRAGVRRRSSASWGARSELEKLGERTITIDCDVFEADGGTRTASVTGGFIALCLALAKIKATGAVVDPVLREAVAATSVGCLSGNRVFLDLAYAEDSTAEFDLNVVASASGAIVEVQGTAEAAPIARKKVEEMTDLALRGVAELVKAQRAALARAGVDLDALLIHPNEDR